MVEAGRGTETGACVWTLGVGVGFLSTGRLVRISGVKLRGVGKPPCRMRVFLGRKHRRTGYTKGRNKKNNKKINMLIVNG